MPAYCACLLCRWAAEGISFQMSVAACIDWLLLAMGTQLFAHWSDDRNTRVALLTSPLHVLPNAAKGHDLMGRSCGLLSCYSVLAR